jgi:hypothetical protein
MRHTLRISLGFVALVVASKVLCAQVPDSTTDFARLAGTWELDNSGDASLSAEQRIITVSPEWLRIEIRRSEDARPPLLTYRFDWQEAENAFGSGKATSRLVPERGAVITETIYEIRNSPITVRGIFSLNPDGTELIVNTTLRVEHGYEGVGAPGETKPPNVSTATRVFRRQQ